jgi:hypothetical protein
MCSHNSSVLKSFTINNFESAHTTLQFWQVSQLIVCRTMWAPEITNVSNKNILNLCYNELINCTIELIFRVSVQVDFKVDLFFVIRWLSSSCFFTGAQRVHGTVWNRIFSFLASFNNNESLFKIDFKYLTFGFYAWICQRWRFSKTPATQLKGGHFILFGMPALLFKFLIS